MIEIALYFTFGLLCIASLVATYSFWYDVISKGSLQSILAILIGFGFVVPCIALLFFPLSESWISKFSAAGLISAFSLVVIAILAIIFSTIFNLFKK